MAEEKPVRWARPSLTEAQEEREAHLFEIVLEFAPVPYDDRWLEHARAYARSYWRTHPVKMPDFPVD